ncbi:ABC transporter permease [Reichenbachiella ulvae]|uniref:ABC transporter permease n=1 Tax=Reichenbachiella ulvae TaxID=2980104 RepID=A0ABT3CW87_9BACT|nr:ABC transporter permease [Reichenbachiella ulvae]MCV9387799.1 ABC transporter permease [Reichenbachiella ulvae]
MRLSQFLFRILRSFCKPELVDSIEGDLIELYQENLEANGKWKAQWGLTLDVIRLFRPSLIKSMGGSVKLNFYGMFVNYLKVGIRSLAQHKMFSILNWVGLSFAMSLTLLVLIVLENVTRFDNFQEHREQIYRVATRQEGEGEHVLWATTSALSAEELALNPAVKSLTRINSNFGGLVSHQFHEVEAQGYLVDNSFFDVFTYSFLAGNPETALLNPNSVVLTESAAIKIFRNKRPIGKQMRTDLGEFVVTGILQDSDQNSHLSFDILGSYSTLEHVERTGWQWSFEISDYVYVRLGEENTEADLAVNLLHISKKMNEQSEGEELTAVLQSIDEIVLGERNYRQIGSAFPILDTLLFISITFLILLPACFNYINLSIARSLKRGKEVGLRKIMGGSKGQLISQFLLETFILTFLAVFGSLVIVSLIKDEFLQMLASSSHLNRIDMSATSVLMALAVAAFTALLAGIIPALYFSKLKPLEAIYSKAKPGSFASVGMRKGLIVLQFALSLGFLIGVFAVAKQYRHSLNYDFGFNKENILVVQTADVEAQLIKQEFLSVPGVKQVSFASHISGAFVPMVNYIRTEKEFDSLVVHQMYIDENHLENIGVTIVDGRNFQADQPTHVEQVLVNEEFVKKYKPADKSLSELNWFIDDSLNMQVIGVVENFNISPLSEKIDPVVLRYNRDQFRYAYVSLQSHDLLASLGQIEDKWGELSPLLFESRFLHHHIEEAMEYYEVMIKVFGFQGLLVIVISCLGLLGMVVFATESRVKEIGIRKVMGASQGELIWLVSKSFLTLLVIAVLLGAPIAFFLFDYMLLKTSYYTEGVGYGEVILAVVTMFVLAGGMIYWQTKKVAQMNPVDSIRLE